MVTVGNHRWKFGFKKYPFSGKAEDGNVCGGRILATAHMGSAIKPRNDSVDLGEVHLF